MALVASHDRLHRLYVPLASVIRVLGHLRHRLASIVPPDTLLGSNHWNESSWARQHEVSETRWVVNIACNHIVNVKSLVLEPALLAKPGQQLGEQVEVDAVVGLLTANSVLCRPLTLLSVLCRLKRMRTAIWSSLWGVNRILCDAEVNTEGVIFF